MFETWRGGGGGGVKVTHPTETYFPKFILRCSFARTREGFDLRVLQTYISTSAIIVKRFVKR